MMQLWLRTMSIARALQTSRRVALLQHARHKHSYGYASTVSTSVLCLESCLCHKSPVVHAQHLSANEHACCPHYFSRTTYHISDILRMQGTAAVGYKTSYSACITSHTLRDKPDSCAYRWCSKCLHAICDALHNLHITSHHHVLQFFYVLPTCCCGMQ